MDQLTPWEFVAAVDGWKAANRPDEAPRPPSPEEHDEMMAKYG